MDILIYCLPFFFLTCCETIVHRILTIKHQSRRIHPLRAKFEKLSTRANTGTSTSAYVASTKSPYNEVNYDSDSLTPHLRCMAISTSGLRKATYLNDERLLAEVTVGSPRQGPFLMTLDMFKWADTAYIYDDDKKDKSLENITFYDSKKSSTFRKLLKEKWGADGIELGLIHVNLSFEMVKPSSSYNRKNVEGGLISLYTHPKTYYESRGLNYSDTTLFQFGKSIDQPIISLWSDRWNDGKSAQLTIGELDQENCLENWSFTPRLYDMSVYDSVYEQLLLKPEGYLIYLDSITMNFNGTAATVDIGKRILLQYWDRALNRTGHMPYHLKFFFVYASGASYNSTTEKYELDCAMTNAGSVTLNFGNPNITSGEIRSRLVMFPSDYIYFDPNIGKCIVAIVGYPEKDDKVNQTIRLPFAFWNNHCFAYNFEIGEVGFADVREKNGHLAQIEELSDYIGFDH
ncbi:hypothetical protein DdX_15264 [Ditylenchus destructor]|uniref:Uncharacterized protein n=1 Tax=Ditylenchus destructor TaxID=166010 RepID=A0AAD4MPT0_9BILA|nr:hypothetical protein DdX_15264 [Ditylenchus destructor]